MCLHACMCACFFSFWFCCCCSHFLSLTNCNNAYASRQTQFLSLSLSLSVCLSVCVCLSLSLSLCLSLCLSLSLNLKYTQFVSSHLCMVNDWVVYFTFADKTYDCIIHWRKSSDWAPIFDRTTWNGTDTPGKMHQLHFSFHWQEDDHCSWQNLPLLVAEWLTTSATSAVSVTWSFPSGWQTHRFLMTSLFRHAFIRSHPV